jgi:hypothetical protein
MAPQRKTGLPGRKPIVLSPADPGTGKQVLARRISSLELTSQRVDDALRHFGSITLTPLTCAKCRWLNVATSLPRSKAVAATMRS